ncbi:MAG TPA: FKBP-type peptidyl-prolyl cis-trans isomerase [Lysobacter sp.]
MKPVSYAILPLILALSACNKPTADADRSTGEKSTTAHVAGLETEKQRVSYMVGLDVAKTLAPIKDELDLDTVDQAIRTALAGDKPLLDEAQADAVRQAFSEHLRKKREGERLALAEKNRKAGAAFFADNANKPGVKSTASGLQYQVLREGSGPKPKATDTVRVNYVGTLLDGRKFDSTYDRDHAADLALNQVLPGWSEGVTLMPVGSKYRLWVPASLAYGEQGKAGEIEPNATLVFDVELLEIAGQP